MRWNLNFRDRPALGAISLVGFGIILWALLAHSRPAANPSPVDTVIFVTMDGVRLSELLHGVDSKLMASKGGSQPMPFMMGKLAPKGVFLGAKDHGNLFSLGNFSGVSMPSYQSIFSGRFTFCFSNECSPPWGSTLFQSVGKHFLNDALSHAVYAPYSPICGGAKIELKGANGICATPLPSSAVPEEFGDEDAFNAAINTLNGTPPKLLYLALNDSDDTAHSGVYEDYIATLTLYDGYVKALADKATQLTASGHLTVMIVTTDHGRGNDDEWTQHRWNIDGTSDLWLVAFGDGVAAKGFLKKSMKRSLYDIRPTIEYLLGVPPTAGVLHGNILFEIFGKDPRL